MPTAKHTIGLLIFILFLAGCKTELVLEPITEKEAIAYAKALETKVGRGQLATSESLLDDEVFAQEVAKSLSDKNERSSIKEIKKALQKKRLDRELLKQISGQGTAYQFVRHYKQNDRQHVLFRYYSEEGLNYHDFELVKRKGKIGVADAYIYISGEKLSKSLAVIFNSMLDGKSSDKQIDEFARNLTKIKSLYVRQEYTQAKELFSSLPAQVRREKIFQIIHLQICSELSNETYLEAISEFEGLFGNDPSAQLVLFDSYLLKQDYQKSLEALNVIDKTVQDPFLNYFRGLIYTQMDKEGEATFYLEKLYKDLPQFEDGVIELIANYANTKQKEKAEKLITVFKNNTSFDQTKLENIRILYPEFASQLTEN